MDIKVLLGKRIREYRLRYNMTQFQFAEKLGIDDKHLSRIELGKNMPQAETLQRLADVLGIEVKDLFEFSHHKTIIDLKSELNEILPKLSDEQILAVYKYVKTYVI